MVQFRMPGDAVPTSNSSGASASYTVADVFGGVRAREDGPQVFLVHQMPHGATPPHYHEVDQFQVFTTSAGKLGRKAIGAMSVHYADAYTTYGPIISEDQAVDYFTVRINADLGAHYMPASRKEKPRRSGRHFTVPLDEAAGETKSPIPVIERQDDGLAAFIIKLDAGDPLELPPLTGKGRLLTIMSGSLLTAHGLEYRDWAWGSVAATETSTGCVAGSHGASVICLDYPTTERLA